MVQSKSKCFKFGTLHKPWRTTGQIPIWVLVIDHQPKVILATPLWTFSKRIELTFSCHSSDPRYTSLLCLFPFHCAVLPTTYHSFVVLRCHLHKLFPTITLDHNHLLHQVKFTKFRFIRLSALLTPIFCIAFPQWWP
jgi:hypothetical protein